MRRKPSVLLVSMLVHAAALFVIGTAPWWSPITNWPMPRDVLAFTGSPRLAQLADIPLPPPARARASLSPASVVAGAPELAPIVASTGVAPETGREGAFAHSAALAIETPGAGAVEGVGAPIDPPPPPPPARPQAPVRGGLIRPPQKIVHVAAQYPAVARAARVQGVVIIETIIDTQGHVESATVLRSIPLLDQAALDAVRQWRFTPTTLNGVPVPVVMTVTVNFKLTD